MNPTFELQKQIMENSKSINDYYKDLFEWEKEVSKKDNIINKQNNVTTKPKIQSAVEVEKQEKQEKPQANVNKKLKRDVNSIGDYYKEWDKINEEADLQDVDSKITVNSDSSQIKSELNNLKTSNAKSNTNIMIKNNRLGNSGTYAEDYIEKVKNEANAYFAIANYNKSIETNIALLKFIQDEEKKNLSANFLSSKLTIHNNKGNGHLKLQNFKEALKDFEFVIENDSKNVKALFRRGLCYFNLRKFHLALKDFENSLGLSGENERKAIDEFITSTIFEINNMINVEKRKMENFEFSENYKLNKVKIEEINSENFNEESKNELLLNINKNTITNITNNKTNNNSNTTKPTKVPQTVNIRNDDMVKFVYDITTENLSASSFKYAFRNFKDNKKEKEDYLLKINPNSIPKIFINDLDREILNEIFVCFKGILERDTNYQSVIVEYLRNLVKTNRFKLVIKLMSKKDKIIVNEIFEKLKDISDSETIPLKDNFY